MKLTDSQKRFFYQKGYVKVSGVVPAVMVDAARQAINAQMGIHVHNEFINRGAGFYRGQMTVKSIYMENEWMIY